MAFPTTGVLDTGIRADEGPPPSASWSASGVNSASNLLQVVSNKIVTTASNQNGVWGTEYGPDSEIYLTVTTLPVNIGSVQLNFRLKQYGSSLVDGYRLIFTRIDANPGFSLGIFRLDNNVQTQLGSTVNDTAGAISTGIGFGADIVGTSITGYVNRSGSWSPVDTQSDGTYALAGGIGVRAGIFGFNDFGGGTYSAPSTDTGLAWITA